MGSASPKKKNKPEKIKDFISWFEIPAIQFVQSVAFYNHIYGISMETAKHNDYAMAYFPSEKGIGGAIVSGPGSVPSETGPLIYLNGGHDLNNVLNKVVEAGGRIIMPKTFLNDEGGYFAIFIDSEGNKLALHSNH